MILITNLVLILGIDAKVCVFLRIRAKAKSLFSGVFGCLSVLQSLHNKVVFFNVVMYLRSFFLVNTGCLEHYVQKPTNKRIKKKSVLYVTVGYQSCMISTYS